MHKTFNIAIVPKGVRVPKRQDEFYNHRIWNAEIQRYGFNFEFEPDDVPIRVAFMGNDCVFGKTAYDDVTGVQMRLPCIVPAKVLQNIVEPMLSFDTYEQGGERFGEEVTTSWEHTSGTCIIVPAQALFYQQYVKHTGSICYKCPTPQELRRGCLSCKESRVMEVQFQSQLRVEVHRAVNFKNRY